MSTPPTMIELMTKALTGTSIAEQRIQERIKEERTKRNANKPTKQARKLNRKK